MGQAGTRASNKQTARELKVALDARQRLLDFYREREQQDAEKCSEGWQNGRSSVYALGVARLEGGTDVYESYQILRAAGIGLSDEAQSYIDSLSRDWRFVCRIDSVGRVWTASLREKNMSSW